METKNRTRERRRPQRRREKTIDATREDTGNHGGGREQVQAPVARPARSSVGNFRPLLSRTSTSSPPIVAVSTAEELGVGLIMLIDAHLRETTCSVLWDPTEIVNKVWVARGRVPPTSTPTPHYNLGL